VAEKPWQATQAAARLKVTWTAGTALTRQSEFYDRLRKVPSRDALLVDSKDTAQFLEKAATVVRARYDHPYQMHGSVGSSCAVADVGPPKASGIRRPRAR
jgi:nicotinate dehydrogenase subunit B